MSDTPPLPPGFTMDAPAGAPPLPPGFTLDGGAPAAAPVATPAAPEPESPFVHGLKTAGDLALSGASHAVMAPFAAAADLGGRLAHAVEDIQGKPRTGNPAADFVDSLTYSTHPGYGRDITQAASQPIVQAADAADQFVGKYGGPQAQQVVRQIAGTGADMAALSPVGAIADSPARVAAASVARTPDEAAAAGGIRVPPSIQAATTGANPPNALQSTLEAIGDRSTVRRADIINAKAATNSLAKQANGIPDDQLLSPASLKAAEKPFADVYRQAEGAIPNPIPLATDPGYASDVSQAGARPNSLRPLPAAVQAERDAALKIPDANGPQLTATISDYRAKGYKGLQSEDVDQQQVGQAQLDIANALEARMGRALPPGMQGQYQQAREGFARINTTREALVGNDVDPQKIRQLAASNPGITGELGYIADMAGKFPKVMTIKTPGLSGNVVGHGIGIGLGGAVGGAAAHILGMNPSEGIAGGAMLAPAVQAAARGLLNRVRPVAAEPNIALGNALADYAKQRGSPFPPDLTRIPNAQMLAEALAAQNRSAL